MKKVKVLPRTLRYGPTDFVDLVSKKSGISSGKIERLVVEFRLRPGTNLVASFFMNDGEKVMKRTIPMEQFTGEEKILLSTAHCSNVSGQRLVCVIERNGGLYYKTFDLTAKRGL